MKKVFKNLLVAVVLVLLLWVLTSCRSIKKDITTIAQTETSKQSNDIKVLDEGEFRAEIEKIVHRALSEQMGMSQKETEYDTDKPVNIETGKPPIKKETETVLFKTTNDKSATADKSTLNQHEIISIEDKSEKEINTNIKTTTQSESTTQKESDIFLKWIGGITILLAILISDSLYSVWQISEKILT